MACLGPLTIDHASLERRSTVPTPTRDTLSISVATDLIPREFLAGQRKSLVVVGMIDRSAATVVGQNNRIFSYE